MIHSNNCRAHTGFGKNLKNIMRYLFDTDKYELIELANGVPWQVQIEDRPWECKGGILKPLNSVPPEKQRSESYGFSAVDEAVKTLKPDVYIGIEDIWAFDGYHTKPWWNKINTMIWTTLDSLPLIPSSVDMAPRLKNYYVWSSFAEKAFKEKGYNHVKTLRGSLDTKNFFRFSDQERLFLRKKNGIEEDSFIIGFVFRNQLRKSVPNLLDGFSLFKKQNPKSKAKLLFHTNWGEGWDIPRLLEEKGIPFSDVLTTYFCRNCRKYKVQNFVGLNLNCPFCEQKGSYTTTRVDAGVNEWQLNEVYNLMDVYCHPFTSGGQEIPIQEAKLTELITLVTDYSCGEDSCTKESGGRPLSWNEYREPGTQFIKASTDPKSICKEIEFVFNLPENIRKQGGKIARNWVIENFSIEVIGSELESILDSMPFIEDYDYTKTIRDVNPDFNEKKNFSSNEEAIKFLYKTILDDDIDKNNSEFIKIQNQMNRGATLDEIFHNLKKIASDIKGQEKNGWSLKNHLDKNDEGKRIAIVIPEFAVDVFLVNGLLKNLKKLYKKHNIYIFTQPRYFEVIEDNPSVFKCLAYSESLEDVFALEGVGNHKGLFDMVFYPHHTTQKTNTFIHNGKTNHQFSLT